MQPFQRCHIVLAYYCYAIRSSQNISSAFTATVTIEVTSEARETMWELCQGLSVSIPNMHCETQESTIRWLQGHTGLCELDFD